jgi:hypothetical protein
VFVLRSGVLAAWWPAFVAGRVSLDQVVDAVAGDDAPHRVCGLMFDGAPLTELLATWRRGGGPVRAVLPVAGDVRGVPGPAAFRAVALEQGEGALGPGFGIVPEIVDHYPSSAPTTVTWQVFAIEPAPADFVAVADAQYDLTTAIRDSATALFAADVAGGVDDIADALAGARGAGEHLPLPPGFPPRAVALLAQAERLQAVLDLALSDPAGGAIDRMGMAARTSALTPLATAVRRARLAGYNAEVRD